MTATNALSKRQQSIADRKDRIFAAAREIIAADGYDALTTRGLAQAAGVTVPTLYNLVGDKAAIVSAMAIASIEELWERLEFNRRATPLEMADAVIDEAFAKISEDKAFSRGTFIALQRLGIAFSYHPTRDDAGAHAARRSVDMAEFAVRAAGRLGQLRGTLPAHELAVQMFAAYRAALDDWLSDAIDLLEMRRRQRWGFYLVLASDASDAFRAELLTRLAALASPDQAPKSQEEAA